MYGETEHCKENLHCSGDVKGQGVALKTLTSYPALDLTAKMLTDDTAKIRCRKTTTAAPVPHCIVLLNLFLT